MGLGELMGLLIAFGFSWAANGMAFLKRHVRSINLAGGILLILIGASMLLGLWSDWIYRLQGLINGFVTPI